MKEVNKMQRFETQLYQINLIQRDTATLTKRRLSLLQEAKSLLGDKNVWSFNGTVFTNINSKREKIVFQEDLYRLVTTIGNPH